MTSIILQTIARLLEPILLFYAIILLFTGHHEPGGGFSAGLMAAGAFVLHVITFDLKSARRMLVVSPQVLMGAGLLLAAGSGLPGLIIGKPFMTGLWPQLHVPGLGLVKLGTPLVFDIGVFLVVVGMVALIVTALTEMQDDGTSNRQTSNPEKREHP